MKTWLNPTGRIDSHSIDSNAKNFRMDPLHERSEVRGCLETSCHDRGPLRNKMATLGVIPSRSDSDPSADPVPGQTMLPTIGLTESDIPGALLKPSSLTGSGYVRLCQAYCWQYRLTRNWIGRRITVRAGRNDFERDI